MRHARTLAALSLVLLLLAWPQAAQAQDNITSTTCPGTGCITGPVAGQGTAGIQIVGGGTWTVAFEGSVDGQTFAAMRATPIGSTTAATTATAAAVWTAPVAGLRAIRVRATSYTSGAPAVYFFAVATGGSSGGGGAGGGSSDTTETTQLAVLATLGAAADAAGSGAVSINAHLRQIATTGHSDPVRRDGAGALNVICDSGCAGSGGTSMADDAAFTVATTNITPAGGTYRSVRDAVDDNDGGAFAMTAKRGQYVTLETPNADSAMDDTLDALKITNSTASTATSYITVRPSDGTNFLTPDTQGTHDTALGTITNITGGVWGGRADSSAITNVTAGDWVSGWFDLGGRVHITGDASMSKLLVTPDANSAVNVAQYGGTNVVNGGTAGIVSIGGSTATNVALTDNPVNIGGQAVSSENAAATTARKVQFVADLVGKQIVLPYANPENFVSGVISSAMTGTTSTSLVASPGGSLRNYITSCTASNSHATVGTDILLQDGSGGTTLWVIPAAAVYGGGADYVSRPRCVSRRRRRRCMRRT
jgi:hypothetical protein